MNRKPLPSETESLDVNMEEIADAIWNEPIPDRPRPGNFDELLSGASHNSDDESYWQILIALLAPVIAICISYTVVYFYD